MIMQSIFCDAINPQCPLAGFLQVASVQMQGRYDLRKSSLSMVTHPPTVHANKTARAALALSSFGSGLIRTAM